MQKRNRSPKGIVPVWHSTDNEMRRHVTCLKANENAFYFPFFFFVCQEKQEMNKKKGKYLIRVTSEI